jgi:glyoxylase I family protein
MLKLNKVHHIAIICSDYNTSKHFYTVILGLEIVREVYRQERDSYKLDLMVGNDYQIELFSFPSPPARASRPESAGLRHLAFEVDDINASAQYLQAQGIIVEPICIDEFTNKQFTFFTDPDGLPLELVESSRL